MEKNFAIACDGFVRTESKGTFQEIVKRYFEYVKRKSLYQYDCGVYELNEDNSIKRRVDWSELQNV